MKKNIIFVFSGTGNSLKVSKDIASDLGNCEIISMGRDHFSLEEGYETIGFIFPVYYRGIPRRVKDFVKELKLDKNKKAYYYSVVTCGKYEGNALIQLEHILNKKNISLSLGRKIDMFSNYVIAYDMRDTVEEEKKQAEKDIVPIINSIKSRGKDKLKKTEPLQEIAYKILIKLPPNMDRHYNISDKCTGCGICSKVCPVNNIEVSEDERPVFKHKCEQCVACIQYCPVRALNYKNKTQNRKRYTHPDIKVNELAELKE